MLQFLGHGKGLPDQSRANAGTAANRFLSRFIELLHRPIVAYLAVRDAPEPALPPVSQPWTRKSAESTDGADRSANAFRSTPSRVWVRERHPDLGGLIGISGAPQLTDACWITVPTFCQDVRLLKVMLPKAHGVDPIPGDDEPIAIAQARILSCPIAPLGGC